MVATVARTNAPDTRQPEDRKQKLNEQTMPLMPVNAASIIVAKPVAYGVVTHRIECCCTFKYRLSYVLVARKDDLCCLTSTRTCLSVAQISRFMIPAPLQQQSMVGQPCGHIPLFFQGWAPPLPQLDGASDAGAPPRPLAQFGF